jgi:hypothetical protein
VRGDFTNDVSETAVGPVFTGHELERKIVVAVVVVVGKSAQTFESNTREFLNFVTT